MSNETTQYTPADVRERAVRLLGLAMERAEWLCRDVGRAEWPLSDFSRDMLQERLDTVRDLIGDALAALRSEAQGEEDVGEFCDLCGEEFDPRESGTVIGPLGQDDGVPRWYRCPRCARAYDAGYQQGQRDPRGDETADPTALRSEAQGDGPVGAVCANCGDPNAAIAGGELDPDEAVCSVECYEQLMELGCPQAHGGTYRPKPARRGEGGGDGE